MIAIGAAMLKYYPDQDPLASPEPADDATAKLALRNFFEAVLQADGHAELRRMYESFYMQAHGVHAPGAKDWSDKEPDGNRKMTPPGAVMSAKNGQ